jgi:hypothetical protein
MSPDSLRYIDVGPRTEALIVDIDPVLADNTFKQPARQLLSIVNITLGVNSNGTELTTSSNMCRSI